MKQRIYIITAILILISVHTFAQTDKTVKENYLGVNLAGNIHTFFLDADFEYQNRDETNQPILENKNDLYNYGYSFGLNYKNFGEKLVGINIELNYIKKGGYNEFKYDINNGDSLKIMFQQDLEYIEMPFMMNLRFGWNKLKLNLYAGPHLGWLFKQKLTILEETFGNEYKDAADFNFEFGLNGGGGISYQIGDHHMIELGMRYSQGLTNIFRFKTINDAVYNQNQVISANAHYYYRF